MDQDEQTLTEALRAARSDYWDDYYAARATPVRRLPSQFATFVAGELDQRHRVIELGCGDGRDAMFFASYGHDVVGVEASHTAVEACRLLAGNLGEAASFIVSRIDEPGLAARVRGDGGPRVVYARFFLHAITETEEECLLDLAAAITDPGDLLAVEYRTVRDSSGREGDRQAHRRFVLLPPSRPGRSARLRRDLRGGGSVSRSTARTTRTSPGRSSAGTPGSAGVPA
jgi:SAM-dependent methyltransferase